MRKTPRAVAILVAAVFTLPAMSGAESIRDAAIREAGTVRLRQTQAAPVLWRSTRTPRLLPIVIGAAVGCGSAGWLVSRFAAEYHEELKGFAAGCLGGSAFGAAIGYIVSAR
jgi:hypothetical protein